MSLRESRPSGSAGDTIVGFIDSVARTFLALGALAFLVGVGFCIYNYFGATSQNVDVVRQVEQNVALFGRVAFYGGIAASLGLCWTMWGEETLGPILLIVAALVYFASSYLTMGGPTGPVVALTTLQPVALPIGAIGLAALAFDIADRARTRVKEGARGEQLKFGKGLKEEDDFRNVFMGKCWQLPYCRKFVRERCPIYHARKSCWKERVGCMCEESVIRNAMEGKVIPSDMVAAAKYIPRNNKLTPEQKAERCRQCVIYNEHQKHKYKLALPVALIGISGLAFSAWEPLSAAMGKAIGGVDAVVSKATLQNQAGDPAKSGLGASGMPLHNVILAAIVFIVIAYAIRFIEYLFFKLKV